MVAGKKAMLNLFCARKQTRYVVVFDYWSMVNRTADWLLRVVGPNVHKIEEKPSLKAKLSDREKASLSPLLFFEINHRVKL
jgi:hypothetical protein